MKAVPDKEKMPQKMPPHIVAVLRKMPANPTPVERYLSLWKRVSMRRCSRGSAAGMPTTSS